jgi:hypothetical protein
MADFATLSDGQCEIRAGTDAALVIGDGTSFSWTQDGPAWWAGTEVRVSDQARTGANGYIAGTDLLGKHTDTIQCLLLGDDASDVGDLIDQWKAACAYSPDELVAVRLNALGRTRIRYGRFRIPGEVDAKAARTGSLGVASAQFEALDPLTYSDDETSDATGRVTSAGGITWAVTWPVSWPAGTSGAITITNGGNAPAPWTARLAGPLTYPEITHVESGRRLALDLSANGGVDLGADDFLDLDSAARSILLNGSADRRSQLTIDSQWWDLDPGDNTFVLAADAGGGTLTVTSRDAFFS